MTTHVPYVLVTGATGGIGRHAAVHLAERGFRVFATGRNQAKLDELTRDAAGRYELTPIRLDVTDASSIAAAAHEIDRLTSGHGIDILVNNAGFGEIAPIEMVGDAELRAQYDTNVFGLMAVTRAFLPAMRRRGAGRIINVSSLGGTFTLPLFGAYNSTKYAVESLSDALRIELRPFGIHVSLVEPGPIRTNFSNHSLAGVERYRADGSPYARVVDRLVQMVQRTDKVAPGPAVTSRAIYHAAHARRPRVRYKVSLSSRLGVALLRALPTRWTDALLRRVLRLTPKHVMAEPQTTAHELGAGRA